MEFSEKKEEKHIALLNAKFLFVLLAFFMLTFLSKGKKYDYIRHTCQDYNRVLSKNMSMSNLNTTATKVMFVAHPDDETIWGSKALYDEKYLVVCITCGGRQDRVSEFKKVMALTEDDYIMLNYPDLVNGVRSNWQEDWIDINTDILDIINSKDWDLVVTHNPEGEYGHIHHKMTNQIVTKYADHGKLTYFGRFYRGPIPSEVEFDKLDASHYAFKMNVLLPVYKTQVRAINNLKNIIPYESWIKYEEWYGDKNEQ